MNEGKRILAIDPGSEQSAYVIYGDGKIYDFGIKENEALLDSGLVQENIYEHYCGRFAIEMIASYGMAVGKTVFETCVWIGRFIQSWGNDDTCNKVYRKDVKMYLCNSMRAKDGNIRQAIIDRYAATGGGKTPQIGTKAKPGPLYGVSKDVWAALAVAITFSETHSFSEGY